MVAIVELVADASASWHEPE